MKKTGLFLAIMALLFTLLRCDPPRYYNYFITNNCQETIRVEIVLLNTIGWIVTENSNSLIKPDSTQLILLMEDYQPTYSYMVEAFFKEIIITKGNDTSKVNYVNKDLWDFRKTSKDHADSYLTVNPEDFE